jgi:hypothetical protein
MAFKIYDKKGRFSFKENKLIDDIKSALQEKYSDNPEFLNNFIPAKNFDELQSLHREYCAEVVDYEEVPENKNQNIEQEHKEFRDSLKETVQPNNDMEQDSAFVDPFNQSNPLVRDYVMDDKFDANSNTEPKKTSFEEPTTFKDAFKMPDSDTQSSKTDKKDKPKEQPLNPSYNEQNNGRKKRTNKKFAKYIVEAVCMLAEKGFIWWTTKDITESKVAQYELNGEIDLSLLLTMPDGQQATVKEWFKSQEISAEHLSKFSQDEKDDLAEVLAELLDKKGVSPTIEQELAIIALKMFGQKFMIAFEMRKGVNSVLEQLRALGGTAPQKRNYEEKGYDEPQQQSQPEPVSQPTQEKNTIVEDIEGNFAGMTDIQEAKLIE